MKPKTIQIIAKDKLSKNSTFVWRIAQLLVWLVGIGILTTLLFFPNIGIHAFWNILIPVAPLLLVVATGLWRNICPLASTSLTPRHLGISKQKLLSTSNHGKVTLLGLSILLIVVSMRHLILDTSGVATAYLIVFLAIVAIYMGFIYDWKSGWCSGLCPIHPVEKLYGSKVAITLPNAHCDSCLKCHTPCSDSTPGMNPLESNKTKYHKLAGILMIGGFPGFIWGWFQVPDYHGYEGFNHLLSIFGIPFFGFIVTFVIYIAIKSVVNEKYSFLLTNLFAAAAVILYYWFRIPALFGFGIYPEDGMLVDLTKVLPYWFPTITKTFAVVFFFWFLVIRKNIKQWTIRPPMKKRLNFNNGSTTNLMENVKFAKKL